MQARAKRHIDELDESIRGFLSKDPYRIHVTTSKDELHCYSEVRELFSTDIPMIIGDAAHNLRSALDLLICALIDRNGEEITTRSSFPFGSNKANF